MAFFIFNRFSRLKLIKNCFRTATYSNSDREDLEIKQLFISGCFCRPKISKLPIMRLGSEHPLSAPYGIFRMA